MGEKIEDVDLKTQMEKCYIDYSMSVIIGRALPDIRDGLKPVHRRILYSMHELGLTPDKSFHKSANVVGHTMAYYHPHGDSSIYDAMVRMAQNFSMRYMLVEGKGNFGTLDGDPPAAYRYTEAKMNKISTEMLRDLGKDTVDFRPNFDEKKQEPEVLPSRFPNLLVNGSNGIAVGMATSIPPHNLKEVIDAVVEIIDNPNATLDDIMNHIKGPDFPTGASIMGREAIKKAYETGRGKIIVRAKTEIEELPNGKSEIIVTEIPYQVNKAMLVEKIGQLVRDKKIEGITDLRDESSKKTGIKIVIETRRDVNPNVVLNNLFKHSSLQEVYSVILLSIVDGEPKILNLVDILQYYLKYQKEVVTRRTKFDLNKALERLHLVQGLLIAIDNIDEVIEIIRSAYDDAMQKLMDRFSLSEVQATAILDMRLRRLQGLEKEKLQDEEMVWKAIKEAQLEDFVKELKDGIHTQIGERGMRLSGGQRQRLGIARALYLNPKILVFDEATSALDNETEAAIMSSINSLHGKKTMIIIAHRLQTIKDCDIVYRVGDGRIIEERS